MNITQYSFKLGVLSTPSKTVGGAGAPPAPPLPPPMISHTSVSTVGLLVCTRERGQLCFIAHEGCFIIRLKHSLWCNKALFLGNKTLFAGVKCAL